MGDPAGETARLTRQTAGLMGRSRQTAVDFLIADIDLAHAMLDHADSSNEPGSKRRSVDNACRAHEVVSCLVQRLSLEPLQRQLVNARLRELSDRLIHRAGGTTH